MLTNLYQQGSSNQQGKAGRSKMNFGHQLVNSRILQDRYRIRIALQKYKATIDQNRHSTYLLSLDFKASTVACMLRQRE